MNLIFGHDQVVAEWAEKRFGRKMAPWFTAVGIIDAKGLLIGAAVFHDWNGANVELAFVGVRALTPGIVRGLAHYCFERLKVTRVTARTIRRNVIVKKALPKFGFRYEGTSPRYYGPRKSDDAINFGLLRPAAERFLTRRIDGSTKPS